MTLRARTRKKRTLVGIRAVLISHFFAIRLIDYFLSMLSIQ